MSNYFNQIPDIDLFILLSCIFILLSLLLIVIVKRCIPIEIRYKDNPVIGYTSGLISIIYGVLVGLTALYLINNINYTTDAVQREANSIANIFRDTKWLNEPTRSEIRAELQNYLTKVITIEWPFMKNGKKIQDNGDYIVDEMTTQLNNYAHTNNVELMILHDMLDEIKALYDARHQRIHMSFSSLNPEIWVVILIGTILTLCINYLFGMNFYLHIVNVSAVALMISAMIFLLVSLDHPFRGEFAVEPDAFQAVLTFIETSTNSTKQTLKNADMNNKEASISMQQQ